MRNRWIGLLGAVTTLVAASPAAAQEIDFEPRPGRTAEHLLDDMLERGDYTLLVRDTVLTADDRIRGDLLVLGAAVRVSGEVVGSAHVVDGDLFLRPGARIGGDVVVLGGGYYASELVTIDGQVAYEPNDLYAVTTGDSVWTIRPVEEVPGAVELPGLYGFGFPYYQRVDAVTLRWGALLRAVDWSWRPTLEGEVRFLTEGSRLQGTVKQYWHPGWIRFGFEAERRTMTNEDWIRGDISNSLSFFFVGDDFRNYYEADRLAFVIGGSETSTWWPRLTVQWEDAESLEAQEQFVLFGDDGPVPNPAVDDGETASLIAELGVRHDSGRSRLDGRFRVEAADSSIAGDFSFVLGEARLAWETPGFAAHRLELFGLARGDLSGELPAQRWTAFGGRGTLPTFDLLSFRGPRVVYGQASYLIPISILDLTMVGPPWIIARVVTGSAWTDGESARFETNLIAGVRWSALEAGIAVDPSGSDPATQVYARLRLSGDL